MTPNAFAQFLGLILLYFCKMFFFTSPGSQQPFQTLSTMSTDNKTLTDKLLYLDLKSFRRIFWGEITHLQPVKDLGQKQYSSKATLFLISSYRHAVSAVGFNSETGRALCCDRICVCLRLKASCPSIKAQRHAASKETTVIQANITITQHRASGFEIEMSYLQVLLLSAKAVFYL